MGSLLRGWPLWVAGSSVGAFHARVRLITQEWRPDIVNVDFHVMGQYLRSIDDCPAPRVLIQHEPGAAAARDRWQSTQGVRRAISYFDMRAWERYERSIMRQVQAVVVFSEIDREKLPQVSAPPRIVCIPAGTLVPAKPLNPVGDQAFSLLFVGNFRHPPNLEGAMRLVQDIFPNVQARVPNVHCFIVGDHPPVHLRRMANEAISVTGRVPDVTPYLDRAAVVIVPVRTGGGIRVKVKEALAAGKALVVSPLAVAGLDVMDGEQVLLAETDEQFAAAAARLLKNQEERGALASRARAWACEHLGWEKPIAAYEDLYEQLTQECPSSRLTEPLWR